MILEISEDEGDFHINFMIPPGPTQIFTWPSRPDICWVSSLHMLCKIDSPKTITGQTYSISYRGGSREKYDWCSSKEKGVAGAGQGYGGTIKKIDATPCSHQKMLFYILPYHPHFEKIW